MSITLPPTHPLPQPLTTVIQGPAANAANPVQVAADLHAVILRFTEEIFGSRPTILVEADPEYSQNYFVVRVAATGQVANIVRQQDQWHRALVDVAGLSAAVFQLSMDIT